MDLLQSNIERMLAIYEARELADAEETVAEWRAPIAERAVIRLMVDWIDDRETFAFLKARKGFVFADELMRYAAEAKAKTLSGFCKWLVKRGVAEFTMSSKRERAIEVPSDFSHLVCVIRNGNRTTGEPPNE